MATEHDSLDDAVRYTGGGSLPPLATERPARLELQTSRLRTQARILETMCEGVLLVDPDNRAVLTNPAFDRMFGYAPGELLARSIEPLFSIPSVLLPQLARTRGGAPEDHEGQPIETECARKDGTRFVAACVVTAITVDGAEQWLMVLNDVTDRRRLEREIIEIANREQQRIGSDLHDGLGQDLTGIALLLKSVAAQLRKEGSAAQRDVEEVIGLVNDAVESTRNLARGLSPLEAGYGGLRAATQALLTRIGERCNVRVLSNLQLEEPLRLSESAAVHVFRIMQEALTNAVRHSGASEVSVHLETTQERLHLRVDDDGRGFSPVTAGCPGGIGLKIMRYRAQMLGGDLVIAWAGNGGTSVRCSCPLEPTPLSASGGL